MKKRLICESCLGEGWPSAKSRMTTISVLRRDANMGTGQHEGMALLIFGVYSFGQSIGLAQEFISSIAKIPAWNVQGLQPISEAPIQDLVVARKFLDAEVMAPKPHHRGK